MNLPLKNALFVLLALAVGYFLWDRHCDYVFINSDLTQHAVSAAYLKGRLAEKTPEVIATVVSRAFRFAVTRRELPFLLGSISILGIFTWTFASELRRPFQKLVAVQFFIYLFYTASLAGMYVFSMSAEGALRLECIDRYMRTIDIAFYYWLLIYSFCLLDRISNRRIAAGTAVLLIAGTLWMLQWNQQFIQDAHDGNDTIRQQIEALLSEYGVAPSHSYLVLGQGENTLYRELIYRYYLNSPNVTSLVVTDAAQLDAQEHHFYILIEDPDNPIIQDWLQEHYPAQAGQRVIQDF